MEYCDAEYPKEMKLLVMMDGWSLLLPGGVDGPQAG